MTAPLFAGFEGARLHWNGHCTLSATRHLPGMGMARHYAEAIAHGAQGFRDTLPERFDPLERWTCARAEAPNALIVWSAVHFDQPCDPVGHAQRVARILGPRDRLIAVNEPSIGPDLSGFTREDATMRAAAMMGAALAINPALRFWTCDPAHSCHDDVWWATDRLVRLFGPAIEVIGCNYHACWSEAPLRDVLRCAADRYPDHRIALTECSWHEGHGEAEARHPHVRSRREWWQHVQEEIASSGVPLVAATWLPWLDMAWEPGQVWPNGWPEAA
jgi:hypothetical protein